MEIKLFTDGAARGNPGPAAIASIGFLKDGNPSKADKEIFQIGKKIGEATNNQAEYLAVIFGLEETKRRGASQVECLLDSELVVNQLNGLYKIKDPKLKPLFARTRELVMELGGRVSFSHIPRRQNRMADKLVNRILG